MDLTMSESTKSYATYIEGEEWGKPTDTENTYDRLSKWMTRCGRPFRLEIGEDGEIYLFYSTARDGSGTARIKLICNNTDRDKLLRSLARDHGLTAIERVA